MEKKLLVKAGIYCRVSTNEQDVKAQVEELEGFCGRSGMEIHKTYLDQGISGLKSNRPAFLELMEDVRKRKINAVIVWKLDRLSRSLKELVATMEAFRDYGVKFISYSQPLDTSTSTGKLLFNLFGIISEFEHSLVSERTKLKLDFLKKNGVHLGRPSKISPAVVYELRERGLSLSKIAKQLDCDSSSVSKLLKKGYPKDTLKTAPL